MAATESATHLQADPAESVSAARANHLVAAASVLDERVAAGAGALRGHLMRSEFLRLTCAQDIVSLFIRLR